MDALRERLRAAAQKGKNVSTGGVGNYINAGAKYVLEVTGAKGFKGYKSDLTGVLEFTVLSATPTESQEVYAKRGKYPNQPGSTVSIANNLLDPSGYLTSLFMDALSAIAHCSKADLVESVKGPDGKPTERIAFEELLQMGDSKEPSPLVGLRVECEAIERERAGKTPVTNKRWTPLPPPEGHPLAKAMQ